jgi:hypothetical protein
MKKIIILTVGMMFPSFVFPESPQEKNNTIALLQLQNLRQAMEFFYIDYSLFSTIENLDDVTSSGTNPSYQWINDDGGALIVHPGLGTVERWVILPGFSSAGPPYLTISSGNRYEDASGDYDEGTLLDPWGEPYYFYTPLGLLDPRAEDTTLRYYGDEFDFYTFISHGADRSYGGGDDLYEQIYVAITQLAISSVRFKDQQVKGSSSWRLEIKGYQFGASQGNGMVFLNGQPLSDPIESWGNQMVVVSLSSPLSDQDVVSLQTDSGATTRELAVLMESSPSSVGDDWALYY